MTLVLELVPIGTLLAIVTTQVLETAVAAQDVLIDKESFKVLSKYLSDIQPVLAELRMRELKDTEAARQALESLSEDVKAAKILVDLCMTKPKFWLLINCRTIVKQAQQVTRDIGKSLALLSLASTEVSADIRNNVNRLQGEMQSAEFEASQSQLRVIDKLELGLREHKTDQGFANDLIREIARAVGVPVEPSEINKELESFRREKEDAAARKEREEEAFMEQVIALLSHADAANSPEQAEKRYKERLLSLGSSMPEEEDIPPLKSFICPLKDDVMIDPVSLITGTTYERKEIQQWFDDGNKIDPATREPLSDISLRPNIPLKQSIEEWVERNYCLKIKAAKPKLQSSDEVKEKDALKQMQQLCEAKQINKDWIAIEGLIPPIVQVLVSSHSRDVKKAALSTLKALVTDHTENKDKVVDAGGVEQVVRCLARDARISTAAVELLSELLLNGFELNLSVHRKISQQKSAILLLVTLRNGSVTESAEKAEAILQRLRDNDDNIVQMAAANWYGPLIECLHKGSEDSKLKMAKALAKMELTDQNIKLLGDEGAIPPLVKMISSSLEPKAAALGALKNLSTNHENKKHIANAGAVPLILDHLVSSKFPSNVRETSAVILERVMCDDGIQFLVDGNAEPLELEPIIQSLLALQQNLSTFFSIRRHVLNALLGMLSGPNGEDVRRIARAANGISILLPLVEGPDQKIRESVIKLLCSLSEGGSQEVSDFLLFEKKFNLFVTFLEDDSRSDIQAAAAGILSTLPDSDGKVTAALIEAEALPAIVQVLKNGSPKAKENAVGALLRFTDPSSLETQHTVVQLGAYPILINLLHSGTILAKSRAAFAIGNLSLNSPRLSVAPTVTGCWCFKPAKPPVCRVHRGPCDVKTTFCLVKADALPGLVNLLLEKEGGAAGATIHALATLVSDDDILAKGANVLHEVRAIDPVLEILSQGTPESKEEAVKLLEKVFEVKEIVEAYGSKARIPLVDLTTQTHGNGTLRRKAAKVLAQLENPSTNLENKKHIANAGAVPLILDHLVSSKFPSNVRETSEVILERVMCDDGIQFLVDGNAEPLELEPIIQSLLALQHNLSTFFSIGRHVLNALLGMLSGPNGEDVRRIARAANGISILLPLVEGPDQKIRESVIKLLCSLSEGCSQEVSDFLVFEKKFNLFVTLLEDDSRSDIQAAAAGILSTLPDSDGKVIAALIEAEALPASVHVLKNGSPKPKENAVGALLRFTGPSKSKEEAVKLLEKVFEVKEIVEAYGSKARIPLVDLTTQTHGNGTHRRKAAKVLAQLEVVQETYAYLLPITINTSTNLDLLELRLAITCEQGDVNAERDLVEERYVEKGRKLRSVLVLGKLGAYPILINLLHSGTILAKSRAAFAIGNLSLNNPRFSVAPTVTGCWCFKPAKPPVCRVHRGPCDVKTTFCLVKADALPGLMNLLLEKEGGAAGVTIHALATLVSDDDILAKGANVLHEARAIDPVLEILCQGTPESKEEAVKLLEK
ncbi:hypothetical protein KI387_032805, partial [Taxus chinensis]